jgi:hypothetical protein
MPQPDRSYIRKGLFMHGGAVPNTFNERPLCQVYKQLQQPPQPTVTLDQIKERIAAATAKVEALRASLKQRQ